MATRLNGRDVFGTFQTRDGDEAIDNKPDDTACRAENDRRYI